jgi:putative zinc finger/helix-turn-helix YgiT family protein
MDNAERARRCSECGKVEVYPAVISYDCRAKHDGTLHRFTVPDLRVWKCQSCGELLFDDATHEQISRALRKYLKLLFPEEIREKTKLLGLTQRSLGEQTGIAEETISRWLSGAYIQSRSSDMLMRLFFEREEAKRPPRQPAVVVFEDGTLCPWEGVSQSQSQSWWFAPTSTEPVTSEIAALAA